MSIENYLANSFYTTISRTPHKHLYHMLASWFDSNPIVRALINDIYGSLNIDSRFISNCTNLYRVLNNSPHIINYDYSRFSPVSFQAAIIKSLIPNLYSYMRFDSAAMFRITIGFFFYNLQEEINANN